MVSMFQLKPSTMITSEKTLMKDYNLMLSGILIICLRNYMYEAKKNGSCMLFFSIKNNSVFSTFGNVLYPLFWMFYLFRTRVVNLSLFLERTQETSTSCTSLSPCHSFLTHHLRGMEELERYSTR